MEFELDDVKYFVDSPVSADVREAKRQYSAVFKQAVKDGSWLRSQVETIAKQAGVWDQDKEAEEQSLRQQMVTLEKKLAEGGYELSEAIADAKKLSELRNSFLELIGPLNVLYSESAEDQANRAYSDYILFACLKIADSKRRYCVSYDDFIAKKESSDPVVTMAILKSIDMSGWNNLPEVQFLNKYDPPKTEVVEDEVVKVEPKPFLENGIPIDDNKQ